MSYLRKSYLTAVVTLVLAFAVTSASKAQSIYVQPDEEFITTGVGTEFDIEIRVDDQFPSLKSFVIHLGFDATKLDTVYTLEGPLLPSSGVTTVFDVFIVDGNKLEVEGLILGAGIDVAGPGLLATIRLKVLETGTVDMAPIFHRLRNVGGDILTVEPFGTIVYIDVPPEPFDLLDPTDGETVEGLPTESFNLEWDASSSVYPGEGILYDLEYGTSPVFDPGQTITVPGLTTTSHTLYVDDLEVGSYYWRVTAVGDVSGFERVGTPDPESFEFDYTYAPPFAFDLAAPSHGEEIQLNLVTEVTFDWDDATSIIVGDDVDYAFYLGPSSNPPTGAVLSWPCLESEVTFAVEELPTGINYWRVEAINMLDQRTLSTSIYEVNLQAGCCIDRVGDANGEGGDEPTIGDVSTIINALFIENSPDPIPCLAEADINKSGGNDPPFNEITIGDVSILMDYLFITGPSLGLADCY